MEPSNKQKNEKLTILNENNEESLRNEDYFENIVSNHQYNLIIKKLSKKFSPHRKSNLLVPTRLETQLEINSKFKNKKFLNNKELEKVLKNSIPKNLKNKKTLSTPLRKPISDKINRKLNSKELNKEISEYDSTVKDIRHADQLKFPADEEKAIFKISENDTLFDTSKVMKPIAINVEKRIKEEINKNQEYVETNDKFLDEDEYKVLTSYDLAEARKLHKEIQQRRMMISFQEAKFRRIRRIKSKNYHRMLKKDRKKKMDNDLAKLSTENLEEALEKIKELDRIRALERASLKHLNTGKWAKYNKMRSQYNEQARNELNEQLKINQAMMKKRSLSLLNDQEENDDDMKPNSDNEKQNYSYLEIEEDYNPWRSVGSAKHIQKIKQKISPKTSQTSNIENESVDKQISKNIEEKIKNVKIKELNEIIENDMKDKKIINEEINSLDSTENISNENQNLVPDDYIKDVFDVTTSHQSLNDYDSEDENFDIADIDFNKSESGEYLRRVLSEFRQDSLALENYLKPKPSNNEAENKFVYLPGWTKNQNVWSGFGIKETRKKQLKQMKNFFRKERILDKKICRAIVMTPSKMVNKNDNVKRNFVPSGATWIPERLVSIDPGIITKKGSIIEPMNPKIISKMDKSFTKPNR